MIDIIETTYRIKCDNCGLEAILTLGKYSPIHDPYVHWAQVGWIINTPKDFCCERCRRERNDAEGQN